MKTFPCLWGFYTIPQWVYLNILVACVASAFRVTALDLGGS